MKAIADIGNKRDIEFNTLTDINRYWPDQVYLYILIVVLLLHRLHFTIIPRTTQKVLMRLTVK